MESREKHARYRVEIRKRMNDKIFAERRQKAIKVDEDRYDAYEYEPHQMLSYIRKAYATRSSHMREAANLITHNVFLNKNSFSLEDLESSDIIDLIIETFEKGTEDEAFSCGQLLTNILGLKGINPDFYFNKGLFDSFYTKVSSTTVTIDMLKVCLYGIGNFSVTHDYVKKMLVDEGFFNWMLMNHGKTMCMEADVYED